MTNRKHFKTLRRSSSSSGTPVYLVCATVLAGCAGGPDVPEPAEEVNQPVSAAAAPGGQSTTQSLTAFELARPSRVGAEVANLTARVARGLGSKTVSEAAVRSAFLAATADDGSVNASAGASLKVTHTDSNDVFAAIDEAVTRDTYSLTDVGFSAAATVFAAAFKRLVAGGAVADTGLDPNAPELSRIFQGEGVFGQKPVERVKEYVFTVPRKINGIEVYATGVKVSVHRSGLTARVARFGATVNSTVAADGSETPNAKGFTFPAVLDASSALARVKAEYPNALVKTIGLRYWLPEDVASAVVVPQYLYFVAPQYLIDGQTVTSRGTLVGYSTRDAAGAPTIWPKPAPNSQGDARP